MTLSRSLCLRRTTDAERDASLRRLRPVIADFAAPLRAAIAMHAAPRRPVAITLEIEGDREADFASALARAAPSVRLVKGDELRAALPATIDYVPRSPTLLVPGQDAPPLALTELAESLARSGREARFVIGFERLGAADAAEALHAAAVAASFGMMADVLRTAVQGTPWSGSPDTEDEGPLVRVSIRLEAATAADADALDDAVRAHLPVRRARGASDEPRRLALASNAAAFFQVPHVGEGPSVFAIEPTPALPPPVDRPTRGVRIGTTDVGAEAAPLYLDERDLGEHAYFVGKTGCGKTTAIECMIASDILAGDRAVVVVDPHGDMANRLLDFIPREHEGRVRYLDFGRDDRFVGMNLFEATSEADRSFAIGELDLYFLQTFGPEIWGPRLQDLFRNVAELLCLDDEGPNTLIDLLWGVMLGDDAVLDRWKRVAGRAESVVLELFLEQILARKTSSGSLEEALSFFHAKLSHLTDAPQTRLLLGQARSTVDFRALFDEHAIVVVNLARGRLAERSTSVIGRVLTTAILQAAMRNLERPREARPAVSLYVDEFQAVVSPALERILTEARKARLRMCLSHQHLDQLAGRSFDIGPQSDLVSAILGNVGTIASFRTSPADAARLAAAHGRPSIADALAVLPRYHAVVSAPSNAGAPVLCTTEPLVVRADPRKRARIVERSLAEHTRAKDEIEREIRDRFRARRNVVRVPTSPFAAMRKRG